MPLLRPSDVTLLELRDSILCVECELISYNNTSKCLACGSSAVMSLSRVLGGTLRGQQTANLVDDETLTRIVYNTIESVQLPAAKIPAPAAARSRSGEELAPAGFTAMARFNPGAAMRMIVERAFTLTQANGAALATWRANRMICQANAGTAVPPIGSEITPENGIAGLCLRTGHAWRCDVAMTDRNVNLDACRELGIRSVIAAPLNHLNRVMGVLQVLSSQACAFDDRDVAAVQLLSQMLVMAFARREEHPAFSSLEAGAHA